MLSVLAQAYDYSYDYTTTTTSDAGGLAALGAMMGLFVVLGLVMFAFFVVCMWKIFTKANVEGWKAIIPIYNTWTLAEIVGRPGWWGLAPLLGVIPYVGSLAAFVVMVIIYIDLAKSFGKDTGFAVLLILLPIIGLPILAFGDAKYSGPAAKSGGSAPSKPATPAATSK